MTDSSQSHYWLYGKHAVIEALQNQKRIIDTIVTLPKQANEIASFITTSHPPIQRQDQRFFDKQLGTNIAHQGVMIKVRPLSPPSLSSILDQEVPKPIIILDQVTDPHNIGAILRSMAAFDAACCILPQHHSPAENATIAKTASGALEHVPLLHVTNIARTMEILKQQHYWCIGFDANSQTPLNHAKLDRNTAIILGSEGRGLRSLTRKHCDRLVHIPQVANVESINVSNCAAIALYTLFNP